MQKIYKKTLFLFRRDLRLEDNTGLLFALKSSESVIPSFIFTPEQIENNPYRGDHCLQFMVEALNDLHSSLKDRGSRLYLFYGRPDEVVGRLIQKEHIDALIVNCDYTPYSRERDRKMKALCEKHAVSFHSFHDALLHPPEETTKKDGNPYTVFTPFYKNALRLPVPSAVTNRESNYYRNSIQGEEDHSLLEKLNPKKLAAARVKASRQEALTTLKNIGEFKDYTLERDFPAQARTTGLSRYLKFTLISPREVYHSIKSRLGVDHELIRALFWRDFFTHIAFFFPYVFSGAFHKKYDCLHWNNDMALFTKWKEGCTGFPIVDAGMREMNTTGFMHNRVRMIVGSFLVKDLHIDWRLGEKYFAEKLIDYDPAVNNGNWQWVASTGCDAQPYFRIFNPWNQQRKFDPECHYIKKWVPELKEVLPETIHKAHEIGSLYEETSYPSPIIEHEKEAKKALHLYRTCSTN